jgi:GGDEF domain-containing protein
LTLRYYAAVADIAAPNVEPDVTLIFDRRGRVLVLTAPATFKEHLRALSAQRSFDVSVCHGPKRARRLLMAADYDLVVIAISDKRRLRNGSAIVGDPRLASVPVVTLGDPQVGLRVNALMPAVDHHLPGDISPDDLARTLKAVWKRTRYLRELSPDTGLPGKAWVFEELGRRIADGRAYGLLFFDIDRFKSVSDTYGFDRAGEFLTVLGDALLEAGSQMQNPRPIIGHIGGDDFLVLCEPDQIMPFTRRVVTVFENAVDKLYDPADAGRGYVVVGRAGKSQERAALVTLSIGAYQTDHPGARLRSLREVATVVSEMKRVAKSQPGSYVAIDRRSRPSVAELNIVPSGVRHHDLRASSDA